jgi:hypothetical protein
MTQLVGNSHLMAAITDFNRALHQPNLQDRQCLVDHPALIETLEQALELRPRFRRLLPGQSHEPDFWNFEPQPRRLMLLGASYFKDLCLRFGLALFAPELAKIVTGTLVRYWRMELGRELLDWALGRGRLFLGQLREDLLSWLELKNPTLISLSSRNELFKVGLVAVNITWIPLPPVLADKAGWRLLSPGQPIPETLSRRTFSVLKKILLSEVAPSWRPCFS